MAAGKIVNSKHGLTRIGIISAFTFPRQAFSLSDVKVYTDDSHLPRQTTPIYLESYRRYPVYEQMMPPRQLKLDAALRTLRDACRNTTLTCIWDAKSAWAAVAAAAADLKRNTGIGLLTAVTDRRQKHVPDAD